MKGYHALMKNKKALLEVMDLGKQYDQETDPEKKAALKKEIEDRCAILKGKMKDILPEASVANSAEED